MPAPRFQPSPAAITALGMTFSGLTQETRRRFTINDSVSAGVVISVVEPSSPAADKRLQAGDVVVEINQEPVKQPSDAAEKLKTLKSAGKTSALLLIAQRAKARFASSPSR